jgi:LacI family gluconate utilization system Gnt-I transcriptional repressor
MTELMQRAAPPDVIFCSSDVLAHGVMTEGRRVGMPGDIAVMGFGDLAFLRIPP